MPDAAPAEFVRQSWNGQYGWRWMFTAVSAPSLVFFFAAMVLAGKPALAGQERHAAARLARLAVALRKGASGGAIGGYSANHQPRKRCSEFASADLLEPRMCKILLIGVFLAVLQQWSGMNMHVQLRGGGVPRGGLRPERHPLQHRNHRHGLPGRQLRGHRHRGSFRPAHPDADRLCRHRPVPCFPGGLL